MPCHRLPEVIAETIRNGEPVIEEGEMKLPASSVRPMCS
jgi:hypothetical protein